MITALLEREMLGGGARLESIINSYILRSLLDTQVKMMNRKSEMQWETSRLEPKVWQ